MCYSRWWQWRWYISKFPEKKHIIWIRALKNWRLPTQLIIFPYFWAKNIKNCPSSKLFLFTSLFCIGFHVTQYETGLLLELVVAKLTDSTEYCVQTNFKSQTEWAYSAELYSRLTLEYIVQWFVLRRVILGKCAPISLYLAANLLVPNWEMRRWGLSNEGEKLFWLSLWPADYYSNCCFVAVSAHKMLQHSNARGTGRGSWRSEILFDASSWGKAQKIWWVFHWHFAFFQMNLKIRLYFFCSPFSKGTTIHEEDLMQVFLMESVILNGLTCSATSYEIHIRSVQQFG